MKNEKAKADSAAPVAAVPARAGSTRPDTRGEPNAAQHTPGPWSSGLIGQELHIRADHSKECAGPVSVAMIICYTSYLTEEMKSNGRLIAAAPDLLAALKACMEELRDLDTNGIDAKVGPARNIPVDLHAQTMCDAENAISKATEGSAS